jgi:hypothetical protein
MLLTVLFAENTIIETALVSASTFFTTQKLSVSSSETFLHILSPQKLSVLSRETSLLISL